MLIVCGRDTAHACRGSASLPLSRCTPWAPPNHPAAQLAHGARRQHRHKKCDHMHASAATPTARNACMHRGADKTHELNHWNRTSRLQLVDAGSAHHTRDSSHGRLAPQAQAGPDHRHQAQEKGGQQEAGEQVSGARGADSGAPRHAAEDGRAVRGGRVLHTPTLGGTATASARGHTPGLWNSTRPSPCPLHPLPAGRSGSRRQRSRPTTSAWAWPAT